MHSVKLLVLQATPFCNIDCKYCYLPNRLTKERMSHQTICEAVKIVFASGWTSDELTIAWHAGEPLVLPVEYYSRAVQDINWLSPAGLEIKHNFQTNGTLITKEWCDFFKMIDARVGISIDGPRQLNDINRLNRRGQSTFDKALAGIRALKENKVDFHVITVLSMKTLPHAESLYKFYEDEGIENVCFNVEEIEGVHKESSLLSSNVEDIKKRFGLFLAEFWNINQQRKSVKYIREFQDVFRRILAPTVSRIDNLLAEPFAIINVDYQGNFSTFCPEFLGNKNEEYQDFIIGNVHTTSLDQAATSSNLKILANDIRAGNDKCERNCDYFDVCGGGAPANKLYENGSVATQETMHCRLTVQVVSDIAMRILDNSENLQKTL